MGLKIDVLCNDGSPIGVVEADINGEIPPRLGVGGAELALLTLCSAWQYFGHKVTLYNDPRELNRSSFEQKSIAEFDPRNNRDILIIFRSPNVLAENAKGKRIWWSCDQYTVGDFKAFSKITDKIVTISRHHSRYFKEMYGIFNSVPIDLPVRTWEYSNHTEKIAHRCIFTSIPDRGLMSLNVAWPLIVHEVPDASLVITSDWRLWVDWATDDMIRPYRLAFAHQPNITYLGAVKRHRLIDEQSKAQIHLYPCTYEELFCISVAESQVAGTFPITSDMGALSTTNMGLSIHGNPQDSLWIDQFVKMAVEFMTNPLMDEKSKYLQDVARKRFSIETVMKKWEEEVFYG